MAYWLAWEEPRAVGDLAHVEKLFVRNLGGLTRARTCAGPARYYGLIRLLIRVHTRRTAIAFPSRPGTSPGTGKTSQVPHKELLHVRKVSDCPRFSRCKPLRHGRCCLLVSELDRHLGIRPVSQLNTRPVVSPVNASRLPSRAEPRASLGVGVVG